MDRVCRFRQAFGLVSGFVRHGGRAGGLGKVTNFVTRVMRSDRLRASKNMKTVHAALVRDVLAADKVRVVGGRTGATGAFGGCWPACAALWL